MEGKANILVRRLSDGLVLFGDVRRRSPQRDGHEQGPDARRLLAIGLQQVRTAHLSVPRSRSGAGTSYIPPLTLAPETRDLRRGGEATARYVRAMNPYGRDLAHVHDTATATSPDGRAWPARAAARGGCRRRARRRPQVRQRHLSGGAARGRLRRPPRRQLRGHARDRPPPRPAGRVRPRLAIRRRAAALRGGSRRSGGARRTSATRRAAARPWPGCWSGSRTRCAPAVCSSSTPSRPSALRGTRGRRARAWVCCVDGRP